MEKMVLIVFAISDAIFQMLDTSEGYRPKSEIRLLKLQRQE